MSNLLQKRAGQNLITLILLMSPELFRTLSLLKMSFVLRVQVASVVLFHKL
jgi:hypothetical protein